LRIVHVSDTHLGYRQYNLDERETDLYEAFQQVLDIAREERADIIVHTGDLFHMARPSNTTLLKFKECVRNLNGIKFIAILGDHDFPKRKDRPPHELFDDIILLGSSRSESLPEKYVIDDVAFLGIPAIKGLHAKILPEILKKCGNIAKNYKHCVLLLHQGIKEYIPFEGAYEIHESDLPRNMSYIACGHIHSRKLREFGNGYLGIAGSTEIMNKDEISSWERDGKGVYIVDLDDGVNVQKVDLIIRPQFVFELEVENLENMSNELDGKISEYESKYGKKPKKPVLHVTVTGKNFDRQAAYEKLQELVKNKILHIRPIFRERDIETEEIKIDISEGINMEKIMKEYFKDEKIGGLAYEIYDHIISDDIEGATKLLENFYKENYGGDEE